MINKPITISLVHNLSSKSFFAIFFGLFGAIWLFIDPLNTFGLLPSLSVYSAWIVYFSLILISLFFAFIAKFTYRYIEYQKIKFITFTVNSSSDGTSHLVRAPVNMQVTDFVNKFLEYLAKGAAGERIRQVNLRYEPILQIGLDESFFDVGNSLTLSQAGITNQSRCQIRGVPKRETSTPLYSRTGR